MNQFDGELAALQHQRSMEALSGPSGVESAVDTFASWASEAGIPGTGLFRKALKSGQTPVETLVAQLESAAYEEIRRIWEYLKGKEEEQKKFAERLKSQEAQCAYFAAVLHGLRTSDPKRQTRLAVLTVNSVYADATEAESLDDMMRSAIELTTNDISLLARIYKSQKVILENRQSRPFSHQWIEQVGGYWEQEFPHSEGEHLNIRGSLMRLQSLGLVAAAETLTRDGSIAHQPFGLLMEGKRFYERLHEIGTTE